MDSCLQSLSLNTYTMDTHTLKTAEAHNVYTTGYTLWAPAVFRVSLNTCTLGIHTVVDPGYTLWAIVFSMPLGTNTLDTYTDTHYWFQMSSYYIILCIILYV